MTSLKTPMRGARRVLSAMVNVALGLLWLGVMLSVLSAGDAGLIGDTLVATVAGLGLGNAMVARAELKELRRDQEMWVERVLWAINELIRRQQSRHASEEDPR